jgi:hypothetical protein
MFICVSFCFLQNQIIHDFDIKATLYVMPVYLIFAKNGGGYDFYANNAKFHVDDDASVMIP